MRVFVMGVSRVPSCFAVLVSAILLLAAGRAAAEQSEAVRVGADAVMLVPFSGWKDTGPGYGMLVGGRLQLDANLSLTLRGGYVHHAQHGQTVGTFTTGRTSFVYKTREIPVLAGLEWRPNVSQGPFAAAEVGYVNVEETTAIEGDSSSDSFHRIGIALGGGYQVGGLRARASVLLPHVADPVKQKGILFGVGYEFLIL